jgi:NAD(P)H-hydrate epimerase
MKRPFSAYDHLPGNIDSVAGVRELDRLIIQRMGDNGYQLMRQAGEAAFQCLRERWPEAQNVCILAGAGNNGGDGWIIAALAIEQGLAVSVLTLGDITRQSPSATDARHMAESAGVVAGEFDGNLPADADLLIDGLLGTGLNAVVQGEFAEAIDAMNAHQAPVFALDIPSGLNASSGMVMGHAVQADATITFIGMKPGLLTCDGPDYCGELHYAGLGLTDAERQAVPVLSQRVSYHSLTQNDPLLPSRRGNSNKGNHGHALLIGGETGFGGAIAMAVDACCRTGAGLTSCATRPANVSVVLARRPECMAAAINAGLEMQPLMDKASVLACGPGLGRSSWAELLLQQVLQSDYPVVLDADALNIIASPGWQTEFPERDVVMTPHPGEAARLLDKSVADIQSDRLGAAQAIADKYHAVVILKGQGSIIASPEGDLAICTDGNPGMATGGMGDVLTGVITGLLSQGLTPWEAALKGACLHSAAADLAASESGTRGLLATDLMPYIRQLVN